MKINTERTVLEHFTVEDTAFILELLNTPSWLKYIGDREIKTKADAENYLLKGPVKSYADNGFGLYKVSLKDSSLSIGMCGIIKRATLNDVDLGFAFLPQYEGKGYARESAEAVLKYACESLKIKKIAAITVSYNQRSIELLKKLNFTFEQIIRIAGDDEELMLFGSQINCS